MWPDTSTTNPVVSVDIYYGFDRDSRTRFWRDAQAVETNGHWEAKCSVYDLNEPLVALAVVTYDCGFNLAMPAGYSNPTRNFSVASEVYTIYPPELANNGVLATAEKERQIDDFSRGLHDWYALSGNSLVHWMYYTRKVNDPSWKGPEGGELSFDITTTAAANTLAVKLMDSWNEGSSTSYVAYIPLPAAGATHISLPLSAFVRIDNHTTQLNSWEDVKYMSISSAYKVDPITYPTWWQGALPQLSSLHWEGGEYTFTNGITSTWLESYGLGLNDLTVLSDTDGDGMVSWEEFVAGTNPTNSSSVLRLTGVAPVNIGQLFRWQAVATKNYTVWFKTNLTDSVWIEQGSGISGVEPSCTHTVVTDSATGFVRIGVE